MISFFVKLETLNELSSFNTNSLITEFETLSLLALNSIDGLTDTSDGAALTERVGGVEGNMTTSVPDDGLITPIWPAVALVQLIARAIITFVNVFNVSLHYLKIFVEYPIETIFLAEPVVSRISVLLYETDRLSTKGI